MSIFSSLKAEIECEMYGRNARILTAFFCRVVNCLCLNPQRFKPHIRCCKWYEVCIVEKCVLTYVICQ